MYDNISVTEIEDIVKKNCTENLVIFRRHCMQGAEQEAISNEEVASEVRTEYLKAVKESVVADLFVKYGSVNPKQESCLKDELGKLGGSDDEIMAGRLYGAIVSAITDETPEARKMIMLNHYQAQLIEQVIDDIGKRQIVPNVSNQPQETFCNETASRNVGNKEGYPDDAKDRLVTRKEAHDYSDEGEHGRAGIKVACILLGIWCVVCIAIIGWLNFERSEMSNQIDALEVENSKLRKDIENKDKELADKEQELSNKSKQIISLSQEKLKLSNENKEAKTLYDKINDWEFGNYESGYMPDREIIIVKEGCNTLAHVYNYTGKSMRPYVEWDNSNVVSVEWGEWINNYTIYVKITANKKGFSTLTFTNDKNDMTFKILVIVI